MKLDLLEKKRLEKNISIRQVALRADIGYATAYDIFKFNSEHPRIDTIKKIAAVLDIHIMDVI